MNFQPAYILGSDGPLANSLSNYQVREPQILLAQRIYDAFTNKKHLIAEAATGTGKSFSCLLAAIEKSAESDTPIVISTHTISLQEQLCNKDVPFLLNKLKLELKAVLVKGRGNYVCLRRANIAIRNKCFGYRRLGEWLASTDDGTRSSVPFKLNSQTWGSSKSDAEKCLSEKCKFLDNCFYQKSRRELDEADIIVTNHRLVLIDLKMKSEGFKGLLPDYKHLIFDEAHEVEGVARQVLTFELRKNDLPTIFDELYNDNNKGLLNKLKVDSNKTLMEGMVEKQDAEGRAKTVNETIEAIKGLIDENGKFFRKVGKFLDEFPMKRFVKRNSIKTKFIEKLNAIQDLLRDFSDQVDAVNYKLAIDFACKRCEEIADGIGFILDLPNADGKGYPIKAAWAAVRSAPNRKRAHSVVVAPIFLKPEMKKIVFNPLDSVVLTSATLAIGGKNPFRMIESSLGVDDPMRLLLPSIFDYEKQAFIVVIDDMPEQKEKNYTEELARQIKKYSRVGSGGTFVLFTSFKVMNEVFDKVKIGLEVIGCQVFCQGKKLGRNLMITEFKKAKRGVLFGVSSFWTGVDIPGKALQKLIIAKLPFPSPGDPLIQAQEEIYSKFKRNFFFERSVPMTAIMLKQGFGRLIRSNADKGMVVILDSRIAKKKYGKMLLGALPSSCPIKYGKRNSKFS